MDIRHLGLLWPKLGKRVALECGKGRAAVKQWTRAHAAGLDALIAQTGARAPPRSRARRRLAPRARARAAAALTRTHAARARLPPQRSTRVMARRATSLGCCAAARTSASPRKRRAPSGAASSTPSRCHASPLSNWGALHAAPARAPGRLTPPHALPGIAQQAGVRGKLAHFKPQDFAHALWGWGACGSAPAGLLSEVGSVVLQQLTAGARWHGTPTHARWPPPRAGPRSRAGPHARAGPHTCALATAPHAPSALVPVAQASTLSCARSTTTCRTSRTSRGASRRRECRNLSC